MKPCPLHDTPPADNSCLACYLIEREKLLPYDEHGKLRASRKPCKEVSGHTYMGKPIEGLSREELLVAFGRMCEQQKMREEAYKSHVGFLESLRRR